MNQIVLQVNARGRQKGEFALFSLLIISFVLYAFTPKQSNVSMSLFYSCFGLMLLSNYIYFRTKKKKNYMDFDTIFTLIYCLVGFSTTFFYNDPLYKVLSLGFPVAEKYINVANLLSLIGLQSYMVGSLRKVNVNNNKTRGTIINTSLLGVSLCILFLGFVVSGGISYYRSVYGGDGSAGAGVSKHILLVLVSTGIVAVVTELYNKCICADHKLNRLVLYPMLIMSVLMFGLGNRTAASMLFLPLICLYTMLFHNIKLKYFLGLAVIGIVAMWGMQNLRASVKIESLENPILLITDLTIPSNMTPTALEYVDTYGYTYGKSMGIVGLVPMASSFVVRLDEDLVLGSADVLTTYMHDIRGSSYEDRQVGLGSTVVADIYMAFGLIGIVLLMYLLGYLVNKYTVKSLQLNYYSLIILGTLTACSVFMIRSNYLLPLRYMLWTLIIANLNKNLWMKRHSNKLLN